MLFNVDDHAVDDMNTWFFFFWSHFRSTMSYLEICWIIWKICERFAFAFLLLLSIQFQNCMKFYDLFMTLWKCASKQHFEMWLIYLKLCIRIFECCKTSFSILYYISCIWREKWVIFSQLIIFTPFYIVIYHHVLYSQHVWDLDKYVYTVHTYHVENWLWHAKKHFNIKNGFLVSCIL